MQLLAYLMMTNAMLTMELKSQSKRNLLYREKESRRAQGSFNREDFPLEIHMFFNQFATFGQPCPIFVTMPHLGNDSFILNITVNTRDYLIDVKITDPKIIPNGWQYTQKLEYLLRKNGIRVASVPYRNCYFYRTYATYFNTKTSAVTLMLTSLENRAQLWAPKYQSEVRVRLTQRMPCEPKISLPFCKNPERPVEIAPNSHLVFMAEVTSNCMDLNFDFVNWNIYDVTDRQLLGHLAKTKNLVFKLLPYKLDFIHGSRTNSGLVLRVDTNILGLLVVARCYLHYLPPSVEPIILGNIKRLVNVQNQIEFKGLLSRDRSKPKSHDIEGQLEWSCNSTDDPKNPYCQNHMSNNLILQIPAKRLQNGSQYHYSLTMISALDRNVRDTAQQSVRGVDYQTFTPHIHCRRNCELGVFARIDSSHLVAICGDCEGFVPRFEWWVSIGDDAPKLLSQIDHLVVFHDVDHLAIKLKMFQPNGLTSEAEKILKRNTGPSNGSCTIFPPIGIESKTIFTINCQGYQSNYPPMLYRYMVDVGVIDSNVPYQRYQLPLPATNALYISICDSMDMCNDFQLEVKVQALNFTPPRTPRGNLRLWADYHLRGLLIHIPDMLSQGQWNRAFVRTLVSVKHIKSTYDGTLIYSYLADEELITGAQLEQLSVLATNMVAQLTPMNYRGAALMANIFIKLSSVFQFTVMELEWLHRDGYNALTAMYVFLLSILGTASEKHPRAMCRVKEEVCSLAQRLGKEHMIKFDQLTVLRINYWLKCTWYLYKCIYYLGVLATKRHYPHDDTFTVHKGGISYQINVTGVHENVEDLTFETIDLQQIITVSIDLLNELKYILQHDTVLFQIISQRSFHNIYWWYPEALPSETNVLFIHAYSPVKYLPSGEHFFIRNPLVYSMNITEFSENPEFFEWMINGSITSDAHIHYYKLTLHEKNMLAVRIVNCSDNMRIALRLHHKPKIKEIRKTACRITPAMRGKRIWMSNFCTQGALAFVSVISGTDYRRKPKLRPRWHYIKPTQVQSKVESVKRARPLNYTILLETYQCNYWKNSTLDPGWSTEYCRTDFEHSFGTSIKCTCEILGPLSARIFPIAAERHLDVIVNPILEINWYMLLIFLLLFVTLFLVLATYMRGIAAHQRHSMMQCNVRREKVIKEDLQLTFNEELLVMVVTGGQAFAGTTSNVTLYFKSLGREQVTYHIRQDPMEPRLTRNSTNKLMLARGPIVLPTRLAFGIDRGGRYPSWYCRSVTIVDLERNVEQFFVVNRWIEHGHTRFMRSPYYTNSRKQKPPYTWCQRFCQRFEELFINWYTLSPILGPWLTSTGPYAMNRFERSCIFICKLSITIALVSAWFGRTAKQIILEQNNEEATKGINIYVVLVLGIYSYILCWLVHLFFEVIVIRWWVKRNYN